MEGEERILLWEGMRRSGTAVDGDPSAESPQR